MVAKFLDDNNREFWNGDGEQQKKVLSLDYSKKQNNFARESRFFVHFLAVVARLRR